MHCVTSEIDMEYLEDLKSNDERHTSEGQDKELAILFLDDSRR